MTRRTNASRPMGQREALFKTQTFCPATRIILGIDCLYQLISIIDSAVLPTFGRAQVYALLQCNEGLNLAYYNES